MWAYQQERSELLQELGRLHRRIKRRPYLASDAEAIVFRLRQMRQQARAARKNVKVAAGPPRYS
jgi:tRNA U34 5-methylaminomethyl-2-thiouridine-forming methyltransferase MnmC